LLGRVVYELMLEMKSTPMDLINAYIGLPVRSIQYRKEPAGLYIVIIVYSDAKSSLER
jgi:hypothetical protein